MNNQSNTLRSIKGIGDSRERILNETLNVYEPTDLLLYTPEELGEQLKDVKPKVSEGEIDKWYRELRRLCEQEYEGFEQAYGGFSSTELPVPLSSTKEGDWEPFIRFAVEYQAKTVNGKTQVRTIARNVDDAAEKRWWGAGSKGPQAWMAQCLRDKVGSEPTLEQAVTVARAEKSIDEEVTKAETIESNRVTVDAESFAPQPNDAIQPASSENVATPAPTVEVVLVQSQRGSQIRQPLSNDAVAGALVLADTPFELAINCEQDDALDHAGATFKRVGTREHYEFEERAVIPGSELAVRVNALNAGTYALFVRASRSGDRNATFVEVPMLLVA